MLNTEIVYVAYQDGENPCCSDMPTHAGWNLTCVRSRATAEAVTVCLISKYDHEL
jgi:hypothetical protein